jgi:hypothetical protein
MQTASLAGNFPQNAPESCPILNLPNEILRHILSIYLVRPRHHGVRLLTDDKPIYEYHAPAMTIRVVCRRFRAVADELPFWYDDDFDLLDLLPRRYFANVRSSSEEESFLKILFADNHLVETLQYKTHWTFRSLGSLSAVLECIPSFSQSTTSVKLYPFYKKDFRRRHHGGGGMSQVAVSPEPAFQQLAVCHRLTSLKFGCFQLRGRLDLDVLSNSCPFLTTLAIQTDFTTVPSGTLARLSNVRQFRLHADYSPVLMPLFPTSSANLLEDLSIITSLHRASQWPPSVINTFVNLTSLWIDPLTPEICEFLTHSRLNLIRFTTTVEKRYEISMESLSHALLAECLRKVETLRLTVGTIDKHAVTTLQPVVDVITTKLLSIRHCVLEMGLDLRWCTQFGSLHVLEQLVWVIVDDAIHGFGPDVFARSKVGEIVFSGFEEFVKKPRILLEVGYTKYYLARNPAVHLALGLVDDSRSRNIDYHPAIYFGTAKDTPILTIEHSEHLPSNLISL